MENSPLNTEQLGSPLEEKELLAFRNGFLQALTDGKLPVIVGAQRKGIPHIELPPAEETALPKEAKFKVSWGEGPITLPEMIPGYRFAEKRYGAEALNSLIGLQAGFLDERLNRNAYIYDTMSALETKRIGGPEQAALRTQIVDYQGLKCAEVSVSRKLKSVDSNNRTQNITLRIILGESEDLAPGGKTRKSYVYLIRALRTNPGFLLETLHQFVPQAFQGSPTESYYRPPGNNEEYTMRLVVPEISKPGNPVDLKFRHLPTPSEDASMKEKAQAAPTAEKPPSSASVPSEKKAAAVPERPMSATEAPLQAAPLETVSKKPDVEKHKISRDRPETVQMIAEIKRQRVEDALALPELENQKARLESDIKTLKTRFETAALPYINEIQKRLYPKGVPAEMVEKSLDEKVAALLPDVVEMIWERKIHGSSSDYTNFIAKKDPNTHTSLEKSLTTLPPSLSAIQN